MSETSIQSVLAGDVPVGTPLTIQGWIRTRRDSKAGFSFLQVNDGSCLANLQVLANNSLCNYENEIKHLTSGCSVSCVGLLVESRGRGQSVELQASEVNIAGWVADPDSYPVQP
ncbi:MAG: OB-fold nucleic acid binding domain-containing protein, partial [Wenzhouxiangellaceae bacterium]